MKGIRNHKGWTVRLIAVTAALMLAFPAAFAAEEANAENATTLEQEVRAMKADGNGQGDDDGMKDRVDKLERKAARDRIEWTGEMRVAADTIHATQAERYDGLALQKGIVDTLFYFQNTGGFPMGPTDVADEIRNNYGDYLFFQDQLTFQQIKDSLGLFTPAQQQGLIQSLLPGTYVPEQDYDNDIWYTTRLRLNMHAEIKENMNFTARLGMYKTWGDSTGIQVFNGMPNSFTLDGTDVGVPNSDIVRVERAYFDWKNLGGSKWYLSIGRRPATSGPPLHIAENELRGGTPNGHVINFQFDGVTIGYDLNEWLPGNTFRFCYGLGFESGFGSGDQLRAPGDRISDVHLGGINWDLYNTDRMHIQTTILGAFKVTDGFNGLLVLPTDPVSGNAIRAPVVLRYTPSANLGNIYLGDVMIERNDGPVTWFLSYAASETDPNTKTTPFGGLMSDPFDVPTKHSGWSAYAGARFQTGSNDFLGVEYNHGSKYWFNFTQAADDPVFSKLATRGDVYEGYWLHEFNQGLGRARLKFQLRALFYDYEYSGSGWQTGAPQELGTAMAPVLGFPTYLDAMDLRAGLTAKF